jgi:hypothetical protein
MEMEREIIFSKKIELYLEELMLLLFEEGYFGLPDSAKSYVECLISFVEKHIGRLPGKSAPDYFQRFGQNMKYITYKANKRTSWYVFYQERNNIYLIRHITNNHVAAQYFKID